jgi:hypothetical protein
VYGKGLWFALVAATGVVGCSSSSPCNIDDAVRSRAGGSAVDCGHVAVQASRAAADACVVQAFQAGKPLFVEYDEQGDDSRAVSAIVRAPDGTVTMLLWDGDPSGGSHAAPTIHANGCDAPMVADAGAPPGAPLACGGSRDLGRVCPLGPMPFG